MKRVALLVLAGLAGIVSTALGYDGPLPRTYDHTLDGLRVVMTTQGTLIVDGKSRFTLTAYVPVDLASVGQTVDIEIRKGTARGYTTVARCTYDPAPEEIGTTVAIPCHRFEVVPYSVSDGATTIYPYVLRRSKTPSAVQVHDGAPFGVPVIFLYDDAFEQNDSFGVASPLGDLTRVAFEDLVSRDGDYYRFTVPADHEVSEIGLEFWHEAGDLDLWVYDASRQIVALSDGYQDRELVVFPVVPGAEYYVRVHNYSGTPAFYDLTLVNAPRRAVLITAGPGGRPNPISPGAVMDLGLQAFAWEGQPLAYRWTATCPALPSPGRFSDPDVRTPAWTAPVNGTGLQQACTLTATVTNTFGVTDTGTLVAFVDPAPDGITIEAGPFGTPNPVSSLGPVQLSVTAADALGHALSYEWQAYCPHSVSNSFTPDRFARAPTWTAPLNSSTEPFTCVLELTVVDAFNHVATASFLQTVRRADVVTFTSVASGTPNPVPSGGTMALAAVATDTEDHPLAYAWSASCPSGPAGTFSPDAAQQSPAWVAPVNTTGLPQTCTLRVMASDGLGQWATSTFGATVESIPDVVTLSGPPDGTPDPVASGGAVAFTVPASDSVGHALKFLWQASCPALGAAGAFVPSASVAAPTWVAPVNVTGEQQLCAVSVTVDDGAGHTASAAVDHRVETAPHVIEITAGPAGHPNPVGSAAAVALSLEAADGYGHTLSYAWTATCEGLSAHGAFLPAASAPAPTWTAPLNAGATAVLCILSVVLSDAEGLTISGHYTQLVEPVPDIVTIIAGPSAMPSPAPPQGTVALSVTAVDSRDHEVAYAWSASCPGLGSAGLLVQGGFASESSWVAPDNRTGQPQPCTISVTAGHDGAPRARTALDLVVESVPDTVAITLGPSGTPNPTPSGGTVRLLAEAIDSLQHPLTYAWLATCDGLGDGGTFAPDAASPAPTWVAPSNRTGAPQTCLVTLTVDDGRGHAASRAYTHTVEALPATLSLVVGPTASSESVVSSGSVLLDISVAGTLPTGLTYLWQSACPGLPANGSFQPSATTFSPYWIAPVNMTPSAQICALSVTVYDGRGASVTGSVVVQVEPAVHQVTITSGPTGLSPSMPSKALALMGVTATDSHGHPLTYAWSASCPGLPSAGSFSPSPSSTGTYYESPLNATGVPQFCTITVMATCSEGGSDIGSLVQVVDPMPHTVTFTAGPVGSPNPSPSSAPVTLSVAAVDSFEHGLEYAWQASCATLPTSGAFVPSANVRSPVWTAPLNTTEAQQACTLTVVARDADGIAATSSFTQRVDPAVHEVTITAGPAGTPNPAASRSVVSMEVSAQDTYDHPLAYAWRASCPGLDSTGTFAPSAAVPSPTWTVPENLTTYEVNCTIDVTVSDDRGTSATGTYVQRVKPLPHTVTITSGPTGTPTPTVSGGGVLLTVSAADSFGHSLSFGWVAMCPGLPTSGSFEPDAFAQPVTWIAPANLTATLQACTITVTASDGLGHSTSGSFVVNVLSRDTVPITITAPAGGTPNPVVSGGIVQASVAVAQAPAGPISYAWSASCPGLPSNGAFSDATTAAPSWTAPANATAAALACTMTVTVTGALGQSVTSTYAQVVGTWPQILTNTGTGGVGSGGSVALDLAGADLPGQALSYLWSATCPGLPANGTFDDPTSRTPVWTAPPNPTGQAATCTLAVSVRDGQGQVQVATREIMVGPAPDCGVTITPSTVTLPAAGGTARIEVSADAGCSWSVMPQHTWIEVTAGETADDDTGFVVSVGPTPEPGQRTGTVLVNGRNLLVVQEGQGYTYYLAEGATIGGFFETRLALLNTDPAQAATVTIAFHLKDSPTVLTHALTVPAHGRATVDASQLGANYPMLGALVSAEFSTVVRSTLPLVVDRTMTWDASRYGAHSETGVEAPSSAWYLAEGATIGAFELYYLVQNPNDVPLDHEIEVTFMLPPPAAPIVRTYSMGASTRTNIPVHLEPGLEDVEVSAIVRTPVDKPVIVERAMYLTTGDLFYGAGHESAGIRSPQPQWFFAEGASGPLFDFFILIGNPNDAAAHVTATFLFDDGTTCRVPVGNTVDGNGVLVVGAKSRQNVWVNLESAPGCPYSLANAAVSTLIDSDLPIVAERTMWWPGPTAATWAEAHNSPGATGTGARWGMADGELGGPLNIETYVLVANTSDYEGQARVTLYFEDGSRAEKVVELVRNSRTTVPVGAAADSSRRDAGLPERTGFGFDGLAAGRRFGIVVESLPVDGQAEPAAIVVERAMYWNGPGAAFWGAGTSALATMLR